MKLPVAVMRGPSRDSSPLRSERVQRLWVIERRRAGAAADAHVFMSAIVAVQDFRLHVLLVRSVDLVPVSLTQHSHAMLQTQLERNVHSFRTLDEALAWASRVKQDKLEHGWNDVVNRDLGDWDD